MRRKRLVYGIADNDIGGSVYKKEIVNGKEKIAWTCPYYRRWKNMLKRCYSEKEIEKRPTYHDCYVCIEWLIFSNFKEWMRNQEWEGMEIDKDLLVKGNRVYSPDTCIFVHQVVNTFILGEKAGVSNGMTGASWDRLTSKYRARVCNPFTGKYEHLGRFDKENDAHQAWKIRKRELATMLADSEYVADERVAKALKEMY